MSEKRATNRHFTQQWGKFFRLLGNFKNQDFSTHLLNCTNTTPEDWRDKVVFEGGCGSGRNTIGAINLGIKFITATDISKGGVDATIENTSNYRDKVKIYQTSVTILKEENPNSYDNVFAVNCINHISNYRDALKEMIRICKPNGLVLLNVPPTRPNLIREIDTKMREHTIKMCPKCLMEFSKIMVYWANKKELVESLIGKVELSGDLLSAYDHYGLPFTSEFTQEQIRKDLEELGCEILKIDSRISIKARKK